MPKPQKHDCSLKLTRVIEPNGEPGVELATVHGAHAVLEAGATALGSRRGTSVDSRDEGAPERAIAA